MTRLKYLFISCIASKERISESMGINENRIMSPLSQIIPNRKEYIRTQFYRQKNFVKFLFYS